MKKIAKEFMKHIQYDVGAVNRLEDESYPEEWVNKIEEAAKVFFKNNDTLEDTETIREIALGGEDGRDVRVKYGMFIGFKELDEVLNDYLDVI